mgnify:CR=1 FL=1
MIDQPLFYLAAIPAVFVTGVSKGGFGGAVAFVSVPTMALFVAPLTAAAIMLPILLAMDAISMKVYWRKWAVDHLKILVPASLIGTALGTFTASYVNDAVFRILLAALAIIFALNLLKNMYLTKSMATAGGETKSWLGWVLGTIAGYSSFFAHAGGPPLNAYLLPKRLEKTMFQATFVFVFTALNLSKIGPYIWLNELHWETFSTAMVLTPWAIFSIYAGVWLHKRVSEKPFYLLCCIGMLATGIKLAVDGLSAF